MTRLKTGGIVGLSLFALTACTSGTGQLAQHFGRSFQSAKFNQILHVEAGHRLQPPEGLAGEAANNAITRYFSSFAKEAPTQPTFVLPTASGNEIK